MILRNIFRLACPLVASLCLAIGTTVVEPWLSLIIGSATFMVWLATYRWPSSWLSSAALLVSVILAAVGLIAGATPALMLLAAILALIGWDLSFLCQAVGPSSTYVTLLEKKHYQILALAIGLALLVVSVGRLIQFQIPFIGLIVLITLAIVNLGRLWQTISGSS